MSRESQRAIKGQREKDLRRKAQIIMDSPLNYGNNVSEWVHGHRVESPIGYTWEELPQPEFVGYMKFFIPAPPYTGDTSLEEAIHKYTQPVSSSNKHFLRKDKKTRKMVNIFPTVHTVYVANPLDIVEFNLKFLPFMECTGRSYDPRRRREFWCYSIEKKYLQIRKVKRYYTHHKVLDGQAFRDISDVEEEFENLGGWNRYSHLSGARVSRDWYRKEVASFKTEQKNLYFHQKR